MLKKCGTYLSTNTNFCKKTTPFCKYQHAGGNVIHIIVTFIFSNWCLIFPIYQKRIFFTKTYNMNSDQLPATSCHMVSHFDKAVWPTDMLFCASAVTINDSVFLYGKFQIKWLFVLYINLNAPMLNSCLLLTPQLDYMYNICYQYLAISLPSIVIFGFVLSCGFLWARFSISVNHMSNVAWTLLRQSKQVICCAQSMRMWKLRHSPRQLSGNCWFPC